MHEDGKLEVPSGWLTDHLSTSFNYPDVNFELFRDTKTLNFYQNILNFFDKEEVEFGVMKCVILLYQW